MLRKKNITLNDTKCNGNEKLAGGDRIKIFFSDETLRKFTSAEKDTTHRDVPDKIKLKVMYEDEDIVIIDKPSGMLSQKASAGDKSLVEYVTEYLLDTGSLTQTCCCGQDNKRTSGDVRSIQGQNTPQVLYMCCCWTD